MTTVQIIEAVLVEDSQRFSIAQITADIGLQSEAFIELIDCELIHVTFAEDQYLLSEDSFLKARRAGRLARDFELAPEGLALAVRLLQRIEELESKLAKQSSQK